MVMRVGQLMADTGRVLLVS
jgi:hypothetical protein